LRGLGSFLFRLGETGRAAECFFALILQGIRDAPGASTRLLRLLLNLDAQFSGFFFGDNSPCFSMSLILTPIFDSWVPLRRVLQPPVRVDFPHSSDRDAVSTRPPYLNRS
jgi:hypothetical protein